MRLRRSHVARLAVVSLVGFGLMGLPGAANADKPHADHAPSARPSGDKGLCLPRTPVDDLHLPVDLPTCAPGQTPRLPSGGLTGHTPKPRHHAKAEPPKDPQADPGNPPICVPLPKGLKSQLPPAIPTCLPKCLSDAVLKDLKKLPRDTLNELLGDVTETLGELPACLTSLLPSPSSPKPPEHPSPSPSHPHRHKPAPKPRPTISSYVPSTAGPATPIPARPDFTG